MTHYRGAPEGTYASERFGTPPYEDCVAASGVNLARAATNGTVPPTNAEVKALRKATGDLSGGEGLADLQKGMLKRYGFGGVRASTWSAIEAALKSNGWVACIGMTGALPTRLQNVGQSSVAHCVAFGPDTAATAVDVDPIQRGATTARAITLAEVKAFCVSNLLSNGGPFLSLRVDEYSEIPQVSVYCRTKLASTFIYQRAPWKRHRAFGVQFTASCTTAEAFFVMGRSREMVEILSGPHKGKWLDIHAAHITYGGAP